jgi:hypothetical protein
LDGGALRLFGKRLQKRGDDVSPIECCDPTRLTDMMAEHAGEDIALNHAIFCGGPQFASPVLMQSGHYFLCRFASQYLRKGFPKLI